MSEPDPRPGRRRVGLLIAAILAALLALAIVALYLARRHIAQEAVSGWLASKGIASDGEFSVVAPGRLVGRFRIGPGSEPDLIVERAEVRYSLAALLAGRGVQVTEVRLTHPVLRARWRGGRFSAGALDPLIQDFLKRPPKPGEPHPRVDVEGGRLLLATDYSALAADVSATIADARLVRMDARIAPTRIAAAGIVADLGAATAQARQTGGRVSVEIRAPFAQLGASGATARSGQLALTLVGPYPDLSAAAPITAAATADLQAGAFESAGVRSGRISLRASAPDLRWARGADRPLTGGVSLSGEGREVTAAQLRLEVVTVDASGPFALGAAPSFRLQGRAGARGGWRGLGTPVAGESPEIAALKRAAAAFRVSAEGLALQGQAGRLRASVAGPVRLLPDRGGEVRLVRVGEAYRLTAAGGGLPRVTADLRRVRISDGAASADGDVRAALSVGPVHDATADFAGSLRIAGGTTDLRASRCAEVRAARFDLGQTPIEGLAARFCPAGEPLLHIGPAGWTVAARAEAGEAAIPGWRVHGDQATGQLHLAQSRGRLSARIDLAGARISDTAAQARFRPVLTDGRVELAAGVWTGAFETRLPSGAGLGKASLRHDGQGVGRLDFATGPLEFRADRLQPKDISPLAASLGAGVSGAARFTGAVAWTPHATASEGRLTLSDLDFKSPLGQVAGLSGEVRFTSLTPLVAPGGQALHIRSIAAALPLADITADLALDEKALVLTHGEAAAGGGRLTLERLELPLEAGHPIDGALRVDGVQVHDLVAASPFGDRVDFDARVSGSIPFSLKDQAITIAGGDLHAIQPGRLSISRAALAGTPAQGAAAPAAQTDTITDFAYQAMENLAFDKLDAGLATRPDGRLGVLFHIVGRHDPPQRQELTLSWLDVVRRRFIGRKLPLPSGTSVDLTLDTTLNVNDLLRDYADYERLRSSPPVQR